MKLTAFLELAFGVTIVALIIHEIAVVGLGESHFLALMALSGWILVLCGDIDKHILSKGEKDDGS